MLDNKNPKVNDDFPISFNIDWLSHPVKNIKVEAIVLRPGEDLGDLLARNSNNVQVSNAQDAGSPGAQKYNHLWDTDSTFRNKLMKSENLVMLTLAGNGKYEGVFKGLTVSGLYRIVYHITGTDSAAGAVQRTISESFYTSFAGIDLRRSGITISMANSQLIMKCRPVTADPKHYFVGPAMGNAFTVSNPGITISRVEDHQDGSYTITFGGNVNDTTTLLLLGQKIYTGKLADAGKSGGSSFIGKIHDWLKSVGLPGWSLWAILFLLLLILLYLLKRKK